MRGGLVGRDGVGSWERHCAHRHLVGNGLEWRLCDEGSRGILKKSMLSMPQWPQQMAGSLACEHWLWNHIFGARDIDGGTIRCNVYKCEIQMLGRYQDSNRLAAHSGLSQQQCRADEHFHFQSFSRFEFVEVEDGPGGLCDFVSRKPGRMRLSKTEAESAFDQSDKRSRKINDNWSNRNAGEDCQ